MVSGNSTTGPDRVSGPQPSSRPETARRDERIRLAAVVTSLVVGVVLLLVKFWAYHETLSTAVLSDALEAIVNVVAAGFALGGVIFAGKPADRSRPYGHGKIEFFTAAFEGGMISFAAVFIFVHVLHGFLHGADVHKIDVGVRLVFFSGLVNVALGAFLIRTGRRHHSIALVADGKHVLSDFTTSAGVIAGLLLVRWTGRGWCDPLVAGMVGINLVRTGWQLVRQAAGGLLDEEDPEVLQRLVGALERTSLSGIIRIHHLRAIRAGRFHHIDAHLVLPEFWSVVQAHNAADEFAWKTIEAFGAEGEIVFHTDPCGKKYCSQCDIPECPVRTEPFHFRPALTVEEAVQEDEDEFAGTRWPRPEPTP